MGEGIIESQNKVIPLIKIEGIKNLKRQMNWGWGQGRLCVNI